MKRCVKKRLAMLLAAATLVTSAGLTSGLTSLAETTKAATEESTETTGTASNATDSNTEKPGDTNEPGDGTIVIPDDVKTEVGVEEIKLGVEGVDNFEISSVPAGEEFVVVDDNTKPEEIVDWVDTLDGKFAAGHADVLKNVNLKTVNPKSFKQFKLSADKFDKAVPVVMTFDEDYISLFANKVALVIMKNSEENLWLTARARVNSAANTIRITLPHFSEWDVTLMAVDERVVATPSRGTSSDRGSNYSSSKSTVSNNANTSTLVGTWKRDAKGWWFQNASGGYVTNRWGVLNGKWYFFGSDGYMKTGWVQWNGAWYYCNPDANNGTEGEMKTGWIVDNGTWYYLGRTGMMETGWVQVNGVYYYLNPVSDGTKGAMAVNTWIGNYYVGANGAWQQNKTR